MVIVMKDLLEYPVICALGAVDLMAAKLVSLSLGWYLIDCTQFLLRMITLKEVLIHARWQNVYSSLPYSR
jgi:hypothetical protein